MKLTNHRLFAFAPATLKLWRDLGADWRRHKLPLYLFLGICFNLVVAPIVYATTTNELSRSQAWSLGLLGLGTVALSIYLFFVMFVPEKF